MYSYGEGGDDKKTAETDVSCRRDFYMALAVWSFGDLWNRTPMRCWVVYADKNFLFCILLSYKRTDFDASHLAWRKCFVTKGLLKTVHEERSSVQIHRKHSLYAQVLDYVSSFPSIR